MKTRKIKHRVAPCDDKPLSFNRGMLSRWLPRPNQLIRHLETINRGPYVDCEFESLVEFPEVGRRFLLVSYNSIAGRPMKCGVVVIDVNNHEAVCDGMFSQKTTSSERGEHIMRLVRFDWAHFQRFVNNHPDCKKKI